MKMYAAPTEAQLSVEVFPVPAMKTEVGMDIAPRNVKLSTVLRRVVSFTHHSLYFPGVMVACANGVGSWASLRAALDRLKK